MELRSHSAPTKIVAVIVATIHISSALTIAAFGEFGGLCAKSAKWGVATVLHSAAPSDGDPQILHGLRREIQLQFAGRRRGQRDVCEAADEKTAHRRVSCKRVLLRHRRRIVHLVE